MSDIGVGAGASKGNPHPHHHVREMEPALQRQRHRLLSRLEKQHLSSEVALLVQAAQVVERHGPGLLRDRLWEHAALAHEEEPQKGPDGRRGGWFTTRALPRFYPFDPRPQDIDPIDIAWALAATPRWRAMGLRPRYSVAEHSMRVRDVALAYAEREATCHNAERIDPNLINAYSIVHDGHETYGADMPRPMKRGFKRYCAVLDVIQLCVWQRFLLPPIPPEIERIVTFADNVLLEVEAKELFPQHSHPFVPQTGATPDVLAAANLLERQFGHRIGHGGPETVFNRFHTELMGVLEFTSCRARKPVPEPGEQAWRNEERAAPTAEELAEQLRARGLAADQAPEPAPTKPPSKAKRRRLDG